MKVRPSLVIVVAFAFVLGGCAMAASPLSGSVFTDVKAPINANKAAGSKKGEACASSILGLIATGDAGIDTAKRNGGISEISSVDYESLNVLMLYARFCTIVRGN